MTKPRVTAALERDEGTCGTEVRLLFKCDWQDQSRRCRVRNTGCKEEIGSCPVNHEHWHRLKAPQVLRATERDSITDFLRKTLKAKIVITPVLSSVPSPISPTSPKGREHEVKLVCLFLHSTSISLSSRVFVQQKRKGPRLSGST